MSHATPTLQASSRIAATCFHRAGPCLRNQRISRQPRHERPPATFYKAKTCRDSRYPILASPPGEVQFRSKYRLSPGAAVHSAIAVPVSDVVGVYAVLVPHGPYKFIVI